VKHTLSLKQLVSICSTHTAHMEALVEKHHGLSPSALVSCLLPPDKTDGGSKADGEESHLLKRLAD